MRLPPKPRSESGPHSPLDKELVKTHWGRRSPLLSVQVRVAVATALVTGSATRVNVRSEPPPRYRPRLTFTAVLPAPDRSYEAPSRGDTSVQLGTLSICWNDRSGTSGPAGSVCAGI